MTLYSIIHGPEIWLGIVGACGIAAIGIIGVCIANSGRLRENEEKARREMHMGDSNNDDR